LNLKTTLLTGLGFLFLGMGAIGVFVPVWPTTPFVLVSVACFSSSPNIKAQIMRVPFFREHIENYENKTGLSRKSFWTSICWLWATLLLSMFFVRTPWIVGLLLAIGIGVTTHLNHISKPR